MDSNVAIALIIFLATVVRSTFGFGDALLAMPLLTILLGVKVAAPFFAWLSSSVAILILVSSWSEVDFRSAKRLIVASIIGIVLGILLLKNVPETTITLALGSFLILFGSYRLIQSELRQLKNPNWAYLFGFISGVLNGAYNTGGPPVVIYGTLSKWEGDRFRATLQSCFVVTGFIVIIGHGLAGLWTTEIFKLYGINFPVVLIATFIGSKFNKHIPAERFENLIFIAFIILGILLIAQNPNIKAIINNYSP